jgi:hypothetical protein
MNSSQIPFVKRFAEFGRSLTTKMSREQSRVIFWTSWLGPKPRNSWLVSPTAWLYGMSAGSDSGQFFPPVAGNVHGQFQAAPDTQFVECATQMALDHRFGRANDLPDFAIRKPLPNEKRDLNFFADARAQKQGAQVLFYGAATKVELARNFLVAAALREQVQNLLVVTFS